MPRLLRLVVSTLIALSAGLLPATGLAQVITNVTASQRADESGLVDIAYTLSGAPGPMSIALRVSPDGGATWRGVSSATGDVGAGVTNGARSIIWNAGANAPGIHALNARIEVALGSVQTITEDYLQEIFCEDWEFFCIPMWPSCSPGGSCQPTPNMWEYEVSTESVLGIRYYHGYYGNCDDFAELPTAKLLLNGVEVGYFSEGSYLDLGPVAPGSHTIGWRIDDTDWLQLFNCAPEPKWTLTSRITRTGLVGDPASAALSNMFCLDTRDPWFEVRHQSPVESRKDVLLTAMGGGPVRICADGSRFTVFRVRAKSCLNAVPADYDFKLASADDEALAGTFTYRGPGPAGSGTFDYWYQHPSHAGDSGLPVRSDTVEVRFRGNMIHQIPIEIQRAPVLLLHGLWGNPSGFDTMEQAMKDSWDGLVLRYGYPNDRSFTEYAPAGNRTVVPTGANMLLDDVVRNRKISAGRVDVVGHSMGGVLARVYLQESQGGPLVRSLVSIDTPHWGSQFANWLTGGTAGAELSSLESWGKRFGLIGGDGFDAPAVHDLAVRSSANIALANGASREAAPMHFIASQQSAGGMTAALRALLRTAAYRDGFRKTLGVPPGPSFTVGDPDALISTVFGGRQHDEIVPLESQLGGLPTSSTAVKVFNGPHHVGVQSQTSVIDWTMEVLNLRRTTALWGAKVQPVPDSFIYSFPSGQRIGEKGEFLEGGVTITQPSDSDSVSAGQSVTIAVEGAAPFEHVLLTVVHNETLVEQVLQLPVSESVSIPQSAHGPLVITALGLTAEENGPVAVDHVVLEIAPDGAPTELTVSPSLGIILPQGQIGHFSIHARYPSGALVSLRDNSSVSIAIAETSVAAVGADHTVETLTVGETELVVQFEGMERRIPIEVLPADAWERAPEGSGWSVF